LTGWPDSGNTWARSLLRRAGVEIEEVKWTLAPLEGGSLSAGRVGQRVPPNVQVGEPGVSLLDGLAQGRLDAIVAPFVPTQMRTSAGPLRHLLPAYETEEADYFMNTQFVPGIHLVTLRRDLCEAHPWLPDAVVRALEQSKQQWWHERARYADTTPWMLQDFQRTSATFGDDWMPYGVEANRAMVGTFCTELAEQGLTDMQVSAEDVFADYAMFAQAADSGQEVQS
jgi:4,5-dihydroxyphthalate decarboxylase